MSAVLVVGGSGILAPLVTTLAGDGSSVVAVGRRESRLRDVAGGTVRTVAADASSTSGAAAIGAAGPFAAAVLYGPAVGSPIRPELLDAVDGRAVVVVTSSAARGAWSYDALRPRPGDGVLLLGWTAAERRWHTPAEVSAAALGVLCGAADATLGVVTPWSERPA